MEKDLRLEYKRSRASIKAEYREKMRELEVKYRTTASRADDPPKRGTLEEIGNAITHGVGALLAVVAYVLMLVRAEGATEIVAASVYFFGAFLAFTASCLYHSFRHGSAVKRLFRRFDYSSIYLLIGATFAPILTLFVGGAVGVAFFVIQWCVIAIGVTLVSVFGPSKLRKLHIGLYLILGWSGLAFVPAMLSRNVLLFASVLTGGIVYTLGIIPFALKKKASHFIWHFFVLAGAIVQWFGIFSLF